jgi:hypothetical protein
MLMDNFGAKRSVHSAGDAEAAGSEQNGELGIRQRGFVQCASERFAHAPTFAHSARKCFVHSAAGLFCHPKGAVHEAARDVFRSCSEARDFVVVDRRGSIHRHVRDHAALEQVDQERRESRFYDVTTEHHDYCALFPACFGNGGDDELEVACDQNVW